MGDIRRLALVAVCVSVAAFCGGCRTTATTSETNDYGHSVAVREVYLHDTIIERHTERVTLSEKGDIIKVLDTVRLERLRVDVRRDTVRDTVTRTATEVVEIEKERKKDPGLLIWLAISIGAYAAIIHYERKK